MAPTFTSAEVAEAERPRPTSAAHDPFPTDAPHDVWAVDQRDKGTLCLLQHLRSTNAEFMRGGGVQHLKNLIVVADDLVAKLRTLDVHGAVERAKANRAARMRVIRAEAQAEECRS